MNAASEQAAGALKGVERRLADMAVLIKNVTTYQKKKPVYDAYRRAKDKAAYRAAHESSIISVSYTHLDVYKRQSVIQSS